MKAWHKGLIGSLAVLALAFQYGFNLDQRVTDAHERGRAALRREPFPKDIVVIGLDDRSLSELRSVHSGGVSRRRYAELLNRLRLARAVGIDMLLVEPDARDPGGDEVLAAAIERHGRVVLPLFTFRQARPLTNASQKIAGAVTQTLPAGTEATMDALVPVNPLSLEPPVSAFRAGAAALGFADINADEDNKYRRPILLRQTNDTGALVPHFTLAVAALAARTPLADAVRESPQRLRLGNHVVPLSEQGSVWLKPIARRGGDYLRAVGEPVPTVGFADALKMSPEAFRDRIVLIGETGTGTADIRATPLDNGLRGVELNAEIVANLLYVSPNRLLALPAQWGLILLAIGLPLYLYAALPPVRATLWAGALLLGLLAAMEGSYWALQQIPAWSTVLIGFVSATLITGQQRLREEAALKQLLRDRFASYVAPEMVSRLVSDPNRVDQKARRVRAGILFSDVRGFTTYTEQNPPDLVRRQMEEYLTEMTRSVHGQRGVLDKFIGDAVMGLFGPFYEEEGGEAAKALSCALDMLDRLDALNARWEAEGLPPFKIGIGLHVGDILFGEFGSPDRYTLTALGDNVNLAARLESATKDFKAGILVSSDIKEEAEAALGHLALFEDRGEFVARGRGHATHIYSVVRRKDIAFASGALPAAAAVSTV